MPAQFVRLQPRTSGNHRTGRTHVVMDALSLDVERRRGVGFDGRDAIHARSDVANVAFTRRRGTTTAVNVVVLSRARGTIRRKVGIDLAIVRPHHRIACRHRMARAMRRIRRRG